MTKVLYTGGTGRMGRVIREGLAGRYERVVLYARSVPDEPLHPGEEIVLGDLAQVGDLPILEGRHTRLCALDEARDLGCRQQYVVLGLQCRELLPAYIGATARHHHRRVPTQHGQRAANGMKTPKFLFQLLIR